MEYNRNNSWREPIITPYQQLILEPAKIMLHYSQVVFEGKKAYRSSKDEILQFRLLEKAKRMNRSMARMCMSEIPENIFLQAECELLRIK